MADSIEDNQAIDQTISKKQKSNKKSNKKTRFHAQIICTCNRKCATNIDVVTQKDTFDKFSKLKGWSHKTRFIRNCIAIERFKEKINPIINEKKKENRYIYYLPNANGSLTQVCLPFLSNVLQITRSKVFRSVKSIKTNPNAIERRGKSKANKTSPIDMKYLKEFIGNFVTYESTYDIQNPKPRFLHPRMNSRKMYQLYSESCVYRNQKILSETIFRRVFKNDFELSFVHPAMPKCDICEKKGSNQGQFVLSSKMIEERNLMKSAHLETAAQVKADLNNSVEFAVSSTEKTEVFTFELQKVFDLPYVKDNDVFFKKQLWLSMFSVHDEVRNATHNYIWDESISCREAEDVASCLFKHLLQIPKDTQNVILFWKRQFGHTQHMKIALMMKKFFDYCKHSELSTIEQHFFLPQHSFNSCSRSFQFIKKKLKFDEVFVPEDVVNVINRINKKTSSFVATAMSTADFFSCKLLEALLTDDEKNDFENKINWDNCQKIIYKRAEPFLFEVFEFNASEGIPFKLNCIPTVFNATNLIYSHEGPRSISKSKYNDLQQLLKHVPEKHQEFYRVLKHDDDDSTKDFSLVEFE